MKTRVKRLERLEEQQGPIERQFITWKGDVWTPEQQAEAIRRDPTARVFWRTLLEAFPKRVEVPGTGANAQRSDDAT